MARIILNGCFGKMGRVITDAAKKVPDVTIAAGIDKFKVDGSAFPVFNSIQECNVDADVILDFSRPEALDSLLDYAKGKNIPLVLCTTGFTDEQLEKISEYSKQIPLFRSANMSIGINVLSNLLKKVSAFLYNDFDIEIVEKHHNQKVDSPSGTALLLANAIKSTLPADTSYIYGREGISKRQKNEIGLHAVRGGGIIGDHDVIFAGVGETIEFRHTAISREVFAIGAIKACIFMDKKDSGLYSMDDIILQSIKL